MPLITKRLLRVSDLYVMPYTFDPGWHDYEKTGTTIVARDGGMETKSQFRCRSCGNESAVGQWLPGNEAPSPRLSGYPCKGWYCG